MYKQIELHPYQVDLSDTNLMNLNKTIFDSNLNKYIRTLKLSSNNLKQIDKSTFDGMFNLKLSSKIKRKIVPKFQTMLAFSLAMKH